MVATVPNGGEVVCRDAHSIHESTDLSPIEIKNGEGDHTGRGQLITDASLRIKRVRVDEDDKPTRSK